VKVGEGESIAANMSDPDTDNIICLPWPPQLESDSQFHTRHWEFTRSKDGMYITKEEFDAHVASINSAKFWHKRMPLIRKMLLWRSSREYLNAAFHRMIDYQPQELILDICRRGRIQERIHLSAWSRSDDRGRILTDTTKDKHLRWELAICIRKNVYNDITAMRRLFQYQ
jgi:hypothetical protein